MAIIRKISEKIRPKCSMCDRKFLGLSDKIAELPSLKKIGEFRSTFSKYKNLCPNCWNSITNSKCSLCKESMNIFENKKSLLIKNFKKYSKEFSNTFIPIKYI